jgi:hypothetical protein
VQPAVFQHKVLQRVHLAGTQGPQQRAFIVANGFGGRDPHLPLGIGDTGGGRGHALQVVGQHGQLRRSGAAPPRRQRRGRVLVEGIRQRLGLQHPASQQRFDEVVGRFAAERGGPHKPFTPFGPSQALTAFEDGDDGRGELELCPALFIPGPSQKHDLAVAQAMHAAIPAGFER